MLKTVAVSPLRKVGKECNVDEIHAATLQVECESCSIAVHLMREVEEDKADDPKTDTQSKSNHKKHTNAMPIVEQWPTWTDGRRLHYPTGHQPRWTSPKIDCVCFILTEPSRSGRTPGRFGWLAEIFLTMSFSRRIDRTF